MTCVAGKANSVRWWDPFMQLFAKVASPEDSQGDLISPDEFLRRYVVQVASNVLDSVRLEADIEAMIARARGGLISQTRGPVVDEELPSSSPTYDFRAEGDPMIVICDEKGNTIGHHHYYGPAVVLFFNKHGHLDHIDFVGVCDWNGGNRQSPRADYVGEHARLYVQSGLWKHRDGCGKHMAEVSDRAWVSDRAPDWRPEVGWLQPFTGQQTFVVHALQPKVIKGLPFDALWAMASAKELFSIDFDKATAHRWVNSMLILVGSAQKYDDLQKQSQELLRYAVMYGMAMTKSGPGLPALAPK